MYVYICIYVHVYVCICMSTYMCCVYVYVIWATLSIAESVEQFEHSYGIFVRMQNDPAPSENGLAVSYKIKCTFTL